MIVVWFSCGAASAVALQQTIKRYGADHEIRAVNQPVMEEDEDNRRFCRDISEWLDIEVEQFSNLKWARSSAADVWEARGAMSFAHGGAPCTVELKKKARQAWQELNRADWHVLGFTYEERDRHERFILTEIDNVLPVLIDAKLSKPDCADILRRAGIKLPRVYGMGFPNANCIGCVKATSPTYWNLVRRTFPEVFSARARQSRKLGVRLVRVKDERIFLDELDPKAKGAPLRTLPECGLFCEEWKRDDADS